MDETGDGGKLPMGCFLGSFGTTIANLSSRLTWNWDPGCIRWCLRSSQGLSVSRSQGMGCCCGARHTSPPSSMPLSLPRTPPEWIPPPPSRPVPRPGRTDPRILYLFEERIAHDRLETLSPQHLFKYLPPRDPPDSDSDTATRVQLRPGADL